MLNVTHNKTNKANGIIKEEMRVIILVMSLLMVQKKPAHRHENIYRKISVHTVNVPLGLHLIHFHDQPESTQRAQTSAKAGVWGLFVELQANMLKLVLSKMKNP